MCLTQQFLRFLELTINDHLLQVIINFPDPAHKSDIVQLRGPKNEVEKCTKYMQKMVADLVRETSVCCSLLRAWPVLDAQLGLKHLKMRELQTLFWLEAGAGE